MIKIFGRDRGPTANVTGGTDRSNIFEQYAFWIAAILWLAFLVAVFFAGNIKCAMFSGIAHITKCEPQSTFTNTGQFGDSFGAFTALMSAFAAAAAYKAFSSQQRQLEQQQSEFQIQRCEEHLFFLIEEMRTAIREVEFRGEHGQRALLLLENKLIGSMSQHPEPGCITSRSCGELGKLRLQKKAAAAGREFSTGWKLPTAAAKQEQHEVLYPLDKFDASLCLSLEDIQRTFYSFMEEQAGATILHCLRMQAEILKYIESLEAESAVKQKYAALFASQLSDPELHLLLYYGLSHYAAPSRLMTILKEYQVLRPLCQKSPKFLWHRIPELTYYHSEEEIEKFGSLSIHNKELETE